MPQQCAGCGTDFVSRFTAALADNDGDISADIDLFLCSSCEEVVGDLLLSIPLLLARELAPAEAE